MAPFDLKEEILRLKEERNAIILAHSYQTGDIQDMADYVGDSLGLRRDRLLRRPFHGGNRQNS